MLLLHVRLVKGIIETMISPIVLVLQDSLMMELILTVSLVTINVLPVLDQRQIV